MAPTPKSTTPNKKHQARSLRERRQTRIIILIAILVIVSVTGLVGYGILQQTVLQARQPVLKVNGEAVSTREFQMRVRIERQRLINSYVEMAQYAQLFGFDPTAELQNIQNKLNNPADLGQDVLDALINELLTRQEAQRRGIVVTAEEVDAAIREFFGYYPDGTPTPTVTPTPPVYPTLSATQQALVTPTPIPSPFPTFAPPPTPTPDPNATPTPTATPSPTPTPYTLEGYQKAYQDLLDSYANLGIKESDLRRFFENQLYYQRLRDAVTADMKPEEEQVWARHILVADEATALEVRQRLQNGEDFSALAAEYSQDTGNKDNGGDLGWFGRGKMVTEFEIAAYLLKIGEISPPIKTQFGWHIIQALGHEVRPLDSATFEQKRDEAFQQFLAKLKEQAEIQTFDYWIQRVPTTPTLNQALGTGQ